VAVERQGVRRRLSNYRKTYCCTMCASCFYMVLGPSKGTLVSAENSKFTISNNMEISCNAHLWHFYDVRLLVQRHEADLLAGAQLAADLLQVRLELPVCSGDVLLRLVVVLVDALNSRQWSTIREYDARRLSAPVAYNVPPMQSFQL